MDEFKKAYITLGARFENRIRDMFHRVPIYSEYDVTDKRINMIYQEPAQCSDQSRHRRACRFDGLVGGEARSAE